MSFPLSGIALFCSGRDLDFDCTPRYLLYIASSQAYTFPIVHEIGDTSRQERFTTHYCKDGEVKWRNKLRSSSARKGQMKSRGTRIHGGLLPGWVSSFAAVWGIRNELHLVVPALSSTKAGVLEKYSCLKCAHKSEQKSCPKVMSARQVLTLTLDLEATCTCVNLKST
jgi:hypothetical protein